MSLFSAVVLVLIVLILASVLIVVLVLIVLAVILVLVLVIHSIDPPMFIYGLAAMLACPAFQDLSLGLKRKLASSPETIAAVIPPAVAFNPPVRMPRKPSSSIASITPFARVLPKPVSGIVAPAPAKSTIG